MNYMDAITDFFKSPKWMMNLLLAALCCLIPIAGPMVVMGWLITGFFGRQDERPETFPDFDFNNFMTWLQRGLWPFLVVLAVMFGVFAVMMILGMIFGFIGSMGKFFGLIAGLAGLGLNLVLSAVIIFGMKPLILKAIFEQDFVKSFDIQFMKKFVTTMWLEILVAFLFLLVAAMVLNIAGLVALCVGVLLVPPLISYAAMHLDKQIYKLYLTRGGTPLALSAKVTTEPAKVS